MTPKFNKRDGTLSKEESTMIDPVFARNPKEAERLFPKHVAFVGCGSGGSAIALMAARAGIGRFTLVDPDTLSLENLGRHMLSRSDLGMPKVAGLRSKILEFNPRVQVNAIHGKFQDLEEKPDLIVAGTDSFTCEAEVNSYALRADIPTIFCGCWGEASVGEILYVVPGKTPCYQCYAGFRRNTVEIPEIPADPRKYTDPDFDATKLPGQAGLWANILIVAGLSFQVALALLDPESDRAALIDHEHTLFLFNISKYSSPLQPLAVTFGKVGKGCAICDESRIDGLGSNLLLDPAIKEIQELERPSELC
jgi:molybdopterin/thiamine biosynthesis adenylyltransferase